MFGFVHSSLTFKERNGSAEANFEFWAEHFEPTGVLIPAMKDGKPQWRSEAVVTWAPDTPGKVWTTQVPLGSTDGRVLNKLMDYIHQWHQEHQYYQLFSVWNQPLLNSSLVRYLDDQSCNRFIEDTLNKLSELGARMHSDVLLCRTYVVLDADTPLLPVDQTVDKEGSAQMFSYYNSLDAALHKFHNMSIHQGVEVIATALSEKTRPYAFIYDRDKETYYKALLKRPYLELWPMYLSQRFSLPWQRGEDARTKECDPWPHWPHSLADATDGSKHSRSAIVV